MRKTLVTFIALLLASWLPGQNSEVRKNILTSSQLVRDYYNPAVFRNLNPPPGDFIRTPDLPPPSPASPNGKTTMLSPAQLGSSRNVFNSAHTTQNQVWADNALDMVAFVHCTDPNIWGISEGSLQYDLSSNRGITFTNDIGPINPILSQDARHPNITGFNPCCDATSATGSWLVYAAPTINSSSDFDGYVTGMPMVSHHHTPISGTENYVFSGANSYLPSGLTQGAHREFWTVEQEYIAPDLTGNIHINKGVLQLFPTPNVVDVVWSRAHTITPDHETSIQPNGIVVGPNIAFSPDGQTGWIAWIGDLVGGPTVLSPIFMKSTDAGATWGVPVEVDLNTVPWMDDTLQSYWMAVSCIPISTGLATCTFDFDLTVDINGNPHLGVVIGSGSTEFNLTPDYSIYSELTKFLGDVWTTDGGSTWTVTYISPVLAFRGNFGHYNPVSIDNYVQVARDPSGEEIYYSWVDSDTAQFSGNMAGIGFGVSEQLAPNLRVASRRPYQNMSTYPKLVTDGDLLWEGRALYPTMAPIVFENATCNHIPIVMAELLNLDPSSSTVYWYFGNNIRFCDTDYCDTDQMDLGWSTFAGPGYTPPCVSGSRIIPQDAVSLGQSFPNPTAGEAVITFELPSATTISMTLRNIYGQEVATIASGDFAAGAHRVNVDTKALAAGVYFYTLTANNNAYTKKMIVTK